MSVVKIVIQITLLDFLRHEIKQRIKEERCQGFGDIMQVAITWSEEEEDLQEVPSSLRCG